MVLVNNSLSLTAVLLAVTFHAGCARSRATPLNPEDDPIRALLAGREVVYAHLNPAVEPGDSVNVHSPIGTIEQIPAVQSVKHQELLNTARRLYDRRRFEAAADTLRPALREEPDNPFILNEFARALFQVDSRRPESARVYQQLIPLLTTQAAPPPNAIVTDLWFTDAHWKLAMLYMDIGAYGAALAELVKVALAGNPDPRAREQLYAYLAETFFFLRDMKAAEWYVQETLQLNRRNRYVLQFRTKR